MPFNQLGQWEPLARERLLPNNSAVLCQFMDITTLKRCTTRLTSSNLKHCGECGILICIKHFKRQYKGYRFCDMCYSELSKANFTSNSSVKLTLTGPQASRSSASRHARNLKDYHHGNVNRLILSLDFDGCLGKSCRLNSSKLIKTDNIVEELKKEISCFDIASLMIGSNRQSIWHESINTQTTKKRCFPFMQELAKELGVELDTFLLADLHHDLLEGQSFKLGVSCSFQELCSTEEHKNTYAFDEGKITLIYTQSHRAAYLYPNDKITLHFYDDKEYILLKLMNFFSRHTVLLPNNFVLILTQYAGNSFTRRLATIFGTGTVDIAYRETYNKYAIKKYDNLYERNSGNILLDARK